MSERIVGSNPTRGTGLSHGVAVLMTAALKYTERLDYVKLVQNMHRLPFPRPLGTRVVRPSCRPALICWVALQSASTSYPAPNPRGEIGSRSRLRTCVLTDCQFESDRGYLQGRTAGKCRLHDRAASRRSLANT